MATVIFTEAARREYQRLPERIKARVIAVVTRLQRWPQISGARPLRGKLAGRFRIRTGDYRVQFYLDGDRVVIEKVGHRDGFYDD